MSMSITQNYTEKVRTLLQQCGTGNLHMQVEYQTPNGYFPYASPKDEDCLPILLVSCPITHEPPLDISITLFILLFHIKFFPSQIWPSRHD